MTMPHLMNCSHSEDGWCLDCVKEMWLEYNPVIKPRADKGRPLYCIVCSCKMYEECPDRMNKQPSGGGEIQIRFDYGSRHDMCFGMPGRERPRKPGRVAELLACDEIVGYICDDCFVTKSYLLEGWKNKSLEVDTGEYDMEFTSEDGDLIQVDEFISMCQSDLFIDYDGFGYPVKNGLANPRITVLPSCLDEIPTDCSDILWFNK